MLFWGVVWLSHTHKLTPAADRASQNSSADGVDDRQTPCVTKKLLAADGFILFFEGVAPQRITMADDPTPTHIQAGKAGLSRSFKRHEIRNIGGYEESWRRGWAGRHDHISLYTCMKLSRITFLR